MKLLLDTHVFLWWLQAPEQIAKDARSSIEDTDNTILVSIVSLWEIAIKRSLGKLEAPVDLVHDVNRVGFIQLQIQTIHLVELESLPSHHRDPFDRLLVAQSRVESATLVSRDEQIFRYEGQLMRA